MLYLTRICGHCGVEVRESCMDYLELSLGLKEWLWFVNRGEKGEYSLGKAMAAGMMRI